MKTLRSAVILAPLLFAGACMAPGSDGDTEDSTSQDVTDPSQGPTQDPRAPLPPPPPPPSSPSPPPATSAVSPTISPSASFKYVAANGSYTCGSGNLCTAVWDPTVSKWKVFFLFTCHTYSLSNWLGSGTYLDNQTGNPLSTFYGQSMNVLRTFRPGPQASVNWDPVWFIKNC